MKPLISQAASDVEPSRIRKMFNKALEYDEVVSFTVGEPDFTAAPHVVRAGSQALVEGLTRYTENAGILPLRAAIAASLSQENGLAYSPQDEIVVTIGAMGALYLALKTILNPQDEVIVSEPCWTNYIQQIRMCQGIPVSVAAKEEENFDLDIDAISAAVTEKTRAVIINSPCNPTGAVASGQQLQALAKLAEEKDLLIISDEVYKHILFVDEPYTSIASLPGMKKRTIIIDSFSKTHAMTGYRIGYAAGPEEIVKTITKLQENTAACAPTPCQHAAVAALTGPQEHLDHMVTQYRLRRDYLLELIRAVEGLSVNEPQGAFYAFVSIKDTGLASDAFADRLLAEQQVVVVPGTAFGKRGEGYIRLSCATSLETIEKGTGRIADFVDNLRCEAALKTLPAGEGRR